MYYVLPNYFFRSRVLSPLPYKGIPVSKPSTSQRLTEPAKSPRFYIIAQFRNLFDAPRSY